MRKGLIPGQKHGIIFTKKGERGDIMTKPIAFKPIPSPSSVGPMVWRKIPRYIKITFFSTMIIGLVTHMYMLTNKIPCNDDVLQLVDSLSYLASSGRWFLTVPAAISSEFSMPWVNGLLTVFYVAVAACFTASMLKVRKTLYCVLLGAVMVTFPPLTDTIPYMQCVDAYLFAMMLCCIGIYLAQKYKWGFLPAIPLIVCSLATYQATFPAFKIPQTTCKRRGSVV